MTLTTVTRTGLHTEALDHVFTIGASGSSAYTFQGEGLNGTVNNPTLYLTRGKTYRFENGSGGHPIRIQSTSGASGTAYNTGVTNNAGSGTVIVEVQHDAPDVLYYQCTSHAAMNGILYITGALADGGVTTAKIADNAVTTAKIADDAVTVAKIQNFGQNQIAGRIASGTGNLQGLLASDVRTMINVADGATNSPTTTINNNAGGRIITGSGTANTLNAQSNVHVDGSGRFLVGTTTEGNDNADEVTISKDSGNMGMTLRSVDSSNSHIYFSDATSGAGEYAGYVAYQHSDNSMHIGTNSAEKIRIDSSGKVGIGISSPDQTLHVHKGTAGSIDSTPNSVLTLENSGDSILQFLSPSSNVNQIRFGDPSDNGAGYIDYNHGNNALSFGTASGGEDMRLTSAGQLVIGQTYSSAKFEVVDNGYTSSSVLQRISADDSNPYGLIIGNNTCNNGASNGLQFFVGNTGNHFIRARASSTAANNNLTIAAQNNIYFSSGASETERLRVQSGGGISFNGDSAAANALNDYEEGLWTPRLGGTNNYGSYYVDGYGWYVKIGRIVHWCLRFQNQDLDNSSSGGVMIGGFPYNFSRGNANAAVSGGIVNESGGMHNVVFTGSQKHSWYGPHNNNTIYGLVARSNQSWVDWPVSDFHSSAFYMMLSGTYQAP